MLKPTLALSLAALAIGALAAPALRPYAPAAQACTGGYDSLEGSVARSDFVVLADAVTVGDNVNRAPTDTPTVTPTATPTYLPHTPTPPPSTPQAPPVYERIPFDLTGLGATLSVVRAYVGEPPASFEIGAADRAFTERQLVTHGIASCAPGLFSFRYAAGQRYVVFAGEGSGLGLTTLLRFPVDGEEVILHDGFAQGLAVTASDYGRFFSGYDAEPVPFGAFPGDGQTPFVRITADRVPLAALVRAIRSISGAPEITPPVTGSAGLLPQTR